MEIIFVIIYIILYKCLNRERENNCMVKGNKNFETDIRKRVKDIFEGRGDSIQEKSKEKRKPLTDFIHEEDFEVVYITEENYGTHSIVGEMVIGGRNLTRDGGYITLATIEVKPKRDIPIKTLEFRGHTSIKKGDRIIARVLRYDARMDFEDGSNVYDDGIENVYSDRDYKEKESAIEIKNITQGRLEKAVDYVPK